MRRGRGSPEPGADQNLKSRFDLLFRFESQLRSAWLGHPVILDAAGTVSACSFLAMVANLARALLAPNPDAASVVNAFDSDLLPRSLRHRPLDWEECPYQG